MPPRPWLTIHAFRSPRTLWFGVCLTALLTLGAAAAPCGTADDPPLPPRAGVDPNSFRIAVDVPLVMLTVAVRDARGKPVPGLDNRVSAPALKKCGTRGSFS